MDVDVHEQTGSTHSATAAASGGARRLEGAGATVVCLLVDQDANPLEGVFAVGVEDLITTERDPVAAASFNFVAEDVDIGGRAADLDTAGMKRTRIDNGSKVRGRSLAAGMGGGLVISRCCQFSNDCIRQPLTVVGE